MNSDSGTTPAIGNDMMEIVQRIRDLAHQVENEQKTLNIAQQRLQNLKAQEQHELHANDQKRCEYLKFCNARNDVELEIFAVKDQVAACKKSIETYNREREELQEKVLKVQEESKLRVKTIYAPQQVKMDLFLRTMETAIGAKQDKIKQRYDLLASIRAESKELKVKEKAQRKEAEQVRKDLAKLLEAQADGADDEEISAVFTHNQKLIKERAALRKKLAKAQKANDKASDELLEWEEKQLHLPDNNEN